MEHRSEGVVEYLLRVGQQALSFCLTLKDALGIRRYLTSTRSLTEVLRKSLWRQCWTEALSKSTTLRSGRN